MDRFNAYLNFSQNLPTTPESSFLEFVNGTEPLSIKLREKWLYELAINKNWTDFIKYYQTSKDLNLICYEKIAKYNTGLQREALQESIPLWLSGDSSPPSCIKLFTSLLQDKHIDENLISQRIALALDKKNVPLALILLKLYTTPHLADIQTLKEVHQNPVRISKINPGQLNGAIYLYGLKRMLTQNMEKAIKFWQQAKTTKILNTAQQQAFLTQVALYKAMRNHQDTLEWFAKIKPQYDTDLSMDWHIRFLLKHKNWKQVSKLINASKNKDQPCWQYWLARAYEEQGKTEEAQTLYKALAQNRQYYGFLASLRLKKAPTFSNELPQKNMGLLKPYQEFITKIQALYLSKQNLQASRLLNDFISELPKDEASALVYWIDNKLQWHGKSVYLSNNDILNNQLSLRFPLAYKDNVGHYAKQYAIAPELVYAIIRQESSFRDDATSFAGARGLMQIMPYTAKVVSKDYKIPYNDKKQLFLSQKNINIGVAYLKQLAKRFGNHPILIAAAYNAGPKQVVFWLKNHPPKDIDLWIETLPWQETRNYLKNIMAFYIVYQYRLGQKSNYENFLVPLI